MSEYHLRHKSVLYPGSADALALGEAPDRCTYGGELDTYHLGAGGVWFDNPELARQIRMGNGAAADHLKLIREKDLGPEKPQPFPDKLGTPEWYDARHRDHLRRRGGNPPPPSYYLQYGKKYCLKFSEELYPKLSKAGQAWIVSTRMHLQLALEDMLLRNPDHYMRIEDDDQAFHDAAFETHKQAYLDGGLLDLPTHDLMQILVTPEFEDIATLSGLRQIAKTVPTVSVDRVGDLFSEPGALPSRGHLRAWYRGEEDAPDVPFQNVPELPVDAQCEVFP